MTGVSKRDQNQASKWHDRPYRILVLTNNPGLSKRHLEEDDSLRSTPVLDDAAVVKEESTTEYPCSASEE